MKSKLFEQLSQDLMIRTVFSGGCYSQEVNALCITVRWAMLFPRYHVILTSNPSKFTQFDPLTSTESVMKDYQFSRMQKSKGFPTGYIYLITLFGKLQKQRKHKYHKTTNYLCKSLLNKYCFTGLYNHCQVLNFILYLNFSALWYNYYCLKLFCRTKIGLNPWMSKIQ